MESVKKEKIGFIGQGWIGKNYADDFAKRGFDIVRYSLEPEYAGNKEKIKECDIVFIAVPTPTTPAGFDDTILRQAIKGVGKNKIAVIKSTILPGTTESIAKANPEIMTVHSPEFLNEVTAAYDATHPDRNIIGLPEMSEDYKLAAKRVILVLPKAPYELICGSREAELIKYTHNCFAYSKISFINILYDWINANKADWETVKEAMLANTKGLEKYIEPIHKGGRGAGGHCFIKDFAAFCNAFEKQVGEKTAVELLDSMQKRNAYLLKLTNKDTDILEGVYGEDGI